MAPTSTQHGKNLNHVGGKGYPKLKNQMKQLENANANTEMRKQLFVFMCGILQKLKAQRLGVYRCFMAKSDKHVIENIALRNAAKTENEPISIPKMTFKKEFGPNGTLITVVS